MLIRYGTFTTNDNAKLHYAQVGKYNKCKKDLIFLPGWSQSIKEYTVIWQNEELAKNYNIYAIDTRGQGESEKVTYGYQISRLAQDIYEFIHKFNLSKVTTITHSMGCAVIWNYIQNYTEKDFDRYIFVDEGMVLLPMDLPIPVDTIPQLSATNLVDIGTLFVWCPADGAPPAATLRDTCLALKGPNGANVRAAFMAQFFTNAWKAANPSQFQFFVDQSQLMPLEQASDLLLNHCMNDWRYIYSRIKKPALYIGGKASVVTYQSIENEASMTENGESYIFNELVGSHFMFVQDPVGFMNLVNQWLPENNNKCHKKQCHKKQCNHST